MMETFERYLRAVSFWFWIGAGILLAVNSYGGYGAGLGALMFGSLYLVYALRRLHRAHRAANARKSDLALVTFSVLLFAIGIHGSGSFVGEHESNFAPLLAALEQYRNTTGQYPDKLAELVPEYVGSLPECPVSGGWAGDEYYYKRKKGDRFEGTYLIQCVVGVFVFPQRALYESEQTEWWYTD